MTHSASFDARTTHKRADYGHQSDIPNLYRLSCCDLFYLHRLTTMSLIARSPAGDRPNKITAHII